MNDLSIAEPLTSDKESIRVVIRCRPFDGVATSNNLVRVSSRSSIVVTGSGAKDSLSLKSVQPLSSNRASCYTFDSVYDGSIHTDTIFEESAAPIVASVMRGVNGTILAYGQTGSGKTFTIFGDEASSNASHPGIVQLAISKIFNHIASDSSGRRYLVRASFLELYNDEIRDLLGSSSGLSSANLSLREDIASGWTVKDLSTHIVNGAEDLVQLFYKGTVARTTAATCMNTVSSRSHCIFSIVVEASESKGVNSMLFQSGKLHIVDLAGSESQKKSKSEGLRLIEACNINTSLTVLARCIKALANDKCDGKGGKMDHIPYRDSKLTKILKDSLGGNARTLMIATVSAADSNVSETIATLRYASRVKLIKNCPIVNNNSPDAVLQQYEKEIARLREELEKCSDSVIDSDNNESSIDISSSSCLPYNEDLDNLVYRKIELDSHQEVLSNVLAEQDNILSSKRQQHFELIEKLSQMENKILIGHFRLEAEETVARNGLVNIEEEISNRLAISQQFQRKIAFRSERAQKVQDKSGVIQEQVDAKEKRLEDLRSKVCGVQQQIHVVRDQWQKENAELSASLEDINSKLIVAERIARSYIADDCWFLLQRHSRWNDITNTWIIDHLGKAGLSAINEVKLTREDKIFGKTVDDTRCFALPQPSQKYVMAGMPWKRQL